MTLQIGEVVTAFAGLSVAGVAIMDDNAIPLDVANTRKQILFPEPTNFVTDMRIEINSFGQYDQAKMTIYYTLNYTYCHVPIGEGRTGLDAYSDCVAKVGLIIDAISRNTIIKALSLQFGTITVEPVPDPMGKMYLGAHLSVEVKEFIN